MNVLPTEEQELLRSAAREFLAQECPMTLVREAIESESGTPEPLWKRMAELGWMGLSVPTEYGGAGMDLVAMAILLEEMGTVLLPAPYLSTALLGASAIELGGSEAQKQRWLPRLASGELRVALAHFEGGARNGRDGIEALASGTATGLVLSGRKLFVPDAQVADLLIVSVRTESGGDDDGIALVLVDASAKGVSIRPIAYNDPTRKVCEITFDGTRLGQDAVLDGKGGGFALLTKVLDIARVGLCAEMAGGAQRVLDLSLEYAKTREQFGQPIGRFQAIQHKCADMLVKTEGIRSTAYYAAWSIANDADDHRSAPALAKAFCSDAYPAVAGEGIQIHGGLGFTWEQDLHLYYKRAKASETLFGDAKENRELAARILIDKEPA